MKNITKSILIIFSVVLAIALMFFAAKVMPEGTFALKLTFGACLLLLCVLGIVMILDGIFGLKTPDVIEKNLPSDNRALKIVGGIIIAVLSAVSFYFGIII